MRILLASSDRSACEWLEGVLRSAGLSVAILAEPSSTAPELKGVDLLIADKRAAAAIGESGPDRRLLLVPRGEAVDLTATMGGGFMDLVVVPAPEDEVLAKVGHAVDQFMKPSRPPEADPTRLAELTGIVERVAAALRADRTRPKAKRHELAEDMLSVFLLVIDSHESSERGTPGHSRRVGSLVGDLAPALGLADDAVRWLEIAGRLHDIGLVPLDLPLRGEAPLSAELRRALRHHPEVGAEILEALADWGLPVEAVRLHHERVDGSGYPQGREGDRVPLEAQILGAADVFEALTSPRPWRGAETAEGALGAMRTMRGFRDEVLDALEKIAHRRPGGDDRPGESGTPRQPGG